MGFPWRTPRSNIVAEFLRCLSILPTMKDLNVFFKINSIQQNWQNRKWIWITLWWASRSRRGQQFDSCCGRRRPSLAFCSQISCNSYRSWSHWARLGPPREQIASCLCAEHTSQIFCLRMDWSGWLPPRHMPPLGQTKTTASDCSGSDASPRALWNKHL